MTLLRELMNKNLITALFLLMSLLFAAPTNAESVDYIKSIGFHRRTELAPEIQIKNIFFEYQKASNSHDIEKFLSLHDDSYSSSDGYDKESLKGIAEESWKEYPEVRYSLKVLSVKVDLDNATVMTQERLSGNSNASVEYLKGTGYIDSEATAIYYLKRFSNDWKIISDFVINEKTSMRYGLAKYIPMQLDAPSIAAPGTDYTAILKVNMPQSYAALISINNEPITIPATKSKEVFRTLRPDGIQERILTTNNTDNNENAIASIAIASQQIVNDEPSVKILGIAFLSSRVNVIKHRTSSITSEKSDKNDEIEESISEK